jgi:hypothetical protein
MLIASFAGSIVHGAIYVLEALFVIGVIGSALVVLLTSIEDFFEVLKPDTPAGSETGVAHTAVSAHQQPLPHH